MDGKIGDPIHPCRFGVAVVVDVVDMLLFIVTLTFPALLSHVTDSKGATYKTVHLPPGDLPPL